MPLNPIKNPGMQDPNYWNRVRDSKDYFSPEAIRSRISEMIPQTDPVPDELKKQLAARQAGLSGYTPEQMEIMRSQARGQISSQGTQRNRELAASLAARGIRGGAAAAAQARGQALTAAQRGAAEEGLGKQQFMEQQNRLGGFEDLAGDVAGLNRARDFQTLAAQLTGEQFVQAGQSMDTRNRILKEYLSQMV